MIKRIFGITTEETFYLFRDRAKEEGHKMDAVFTAICESYAKGELCDIAPYKQERIEDENEIRQVFSIMNSKYYFDMIDRAKEEGLNLGEALTAMVFLYATEGKIKIHVEKHHNKKDKVDYVKEHSET